MPNITLNKIIAGTISELIDKIDVIVKQETPKIVAQFEKARFEAQGEINGHEKWADNNRSSIKEKNVRAEKANYQGERNTPLIDTGHLKEQITSESNWRSQIETHKTESGLDVDIPLIESFTDSKYDKHQTGFEVQEYISPRGNKMGPFKVPARKFRDLSDADIELFAQELAKKLQEQL